VCFLQEDGSDCSIFSFDITANRSALPLARNAVKKLRTMRHPGVVKVLDTVEVGISQITREDSIAKPLPKSDSYIYIATERLVPLRWHVKRKSLSPETAKWGLCSIAVLETLPLHSVAAANFVSDPKRLRKRSSSSTMRLPLFTVTSKWPPSTPRKAENGSSEDSRCSATSRMTRL
jgi:hypothetical protein